MTSGKIVLAAACGAFSLSVSPVSAQNAARGGRSGFNVALVAGVYSELDPIFVPGIESRTRETSTIKGAQLGYDAGRLRFVGTALYANKNDFGTYGYGTDPRQLFTYGSRTVAVSLGADYALLSRPRTRVAAGLEIGLLNNAVTQQPQAGDKDPAAQQRYERDVNGSYGTPYPLVVPTATFAYRATRALSMEAGVRVNVTPDPDNTEVSPAVTLGVRLGGR